MYLFEAISHQIDEMLPLCKVYNRQLRSVSIHAVNSV